MGTRQPPVGGLPDSANPRSFKDVLASSPMHTTFDALPKHAPPLPHDFQARPGSHRGSPAVFFKPLHVDSLSEKFEWALIGKFSKGYNKENPKLGRPPIEDLQKYFDAFDFHGEFQIGLLDNRHLLLQFCDREDYLRIYSRPVWYIRGMPMRVFKWTNSFHVDHESSIVPIWIAFPRLPVHFFEKNALFLIANLIGLPLRMDSATASLKRPSSARVQVEVDLLKPRPEKVWIGIEGGDGFWQSVTYSNVPDYCCHCWHVGHSEQMCNVHHPELKALENKSRPKHVGVDKGKQKQMYVAKTVATDQAGTSTAAVPPAGLQPSPGLPDAGFVPSIVDGVPSPPAVAPTPTGTLPSVVLASKDVIVTQEIGFKPLIVDELSDGSDIEEIIAEPPNPSLPSNPLLEVTDTPLYLSAAVKDDIAITGRASSPVSKAVSMSALGGFLAWQGAHVTSDSRSLQMEEFRSFLFNFQRLMPLIFPDSVDPSLEAVPRKRGRPSRSLYLQNQAPPPPSHLMVTRSLRSLSYNNLNE